MCANRLNVSISSCDCHMTACLLTEEQQAEQLEAEKERAVERERLITQFRERCSNLESQSRDGIAAGGESFAQLQERYLQLEIQTKEHDAEMAELLSQLQDRCAELEQLQEQDVGLVEADKLLELRQQYIDLQAQSSEHERVMEEKLATLQERCAVLEIQSKEWTEERELFKALKAEHEELSSEQERTRDLLDEMEERCTELENENRDLEEELSITREQLQETKEVKTVFTFLFLPPAISNSQVHTTFCELWIRYILVW